MEKNKQPNCVASGVPLAARTSMRVGGPAKFFAAVSSDEELRAVLAWAMSEKLPIAILGGGNNIIFPDEGFGGIVIHPAFDSVELTNDELIAAAGASLDELIETTLRHRRGGFVPFAGIPGHIGGLVRRNAGGELGWLGERVAWVETMDESGAVKRWSHDECSFTPRHSVFQEGAKEIILRVAFSTTSVDEAVERSLVSAAVNRRMQYQPIGDPSAGRMFQSLSKPEPCPEKLLPLVHESTGRIPAERLISALDLAGYELGGMKIHEQFPNFLVNTGRGTADQVIQIMSLVKMRVRDTLGVQLHDDIQLIGF